jgi:prepilin-type N-terminal cleavage/methylation domain-containing protein
MLMVHCPQRGAGGRMSARGFSLIEMMVSIVVGLLVAAGAIGVIVAIDRSNTEMIQASRLDQEMRALASVIADEVKRARRLHDPITYVGQGGGTAGTFDTVDTSTANCIVYGYQDATLNDDLSATAPKDFVNNYEAIYLNSGAVYFDKDTSAVSCNTGGTPPSTATRLNSTQLNVTGLIFKCVTTTGTNVSDVANTSAADTALVQETCNEIDMTLKAQLSTGDTYEKTITHTYVQQIFIRSGAAKTS